MPDITYALNENGELVYVDSVPTGVKCNCFCIKCHEPLVAKNKGLKRTHHFSHTSGKDCEYAYESMLHLLAKERIRKAFLSSSEFWIKYNYRSFCPSKKECKYITYGKCYEDFPRSYNLKKYYDSCEQEMTFDNVRRRSDLKIFSSQNENFPPVYLEFYVTHESEKEKLHSGNRIIEIKIETEDDILKICKEGFIETGYIDFSHKSKYDLKVDFYGFKNEDYLNEFIENKIIYTRYILDKSGKISRERECSVCKSLKKLFSDSLLEVCVHPSRTAFDVDEVGLLGYSKFEIKNCSICKNYVSRYRQDEGKFCNLYRTLRIPFNNLDTECAKSCKYFELIESKIDAKVKSSLIEFCSIFE